MENKLIRFMSKKFQKRTGFIMVLSMVFIFSFSSTAYAYALFGGHYDHTNITFSMDSSIYSSPSYQSYNEVYEGVVSWDTGTPLYMSEVSGQLGNIAIFAVSDGATNYNAITYNYPDNSGDANHHYTQGVINLNRYFMDGFAVSRRQAITAHEIGHALGLAHNTVSENTLMYIGGSSIYYGRWGIMYPTQDEKNAIAVYY